MTAYAIVGIRLALVLTFLIGMPVLALPQVANWCEAQLYAPKAKRRIVAARVLPATPTVVPVAALGDRTPLPWIAHADHIEAAEDPSPAPAAEPAQDLGALAAEVQTLGATFYRLDQVQSSPDQYQFTAQVALPGAVPQRAQYSATAARPGDAMQQVIDQMRAGR